MITTHPLFLPRSLVESHGFDLDDGDLIFKHRALAFSPSGNAYALSLVSYRPANGPGGGTAGERPCHCHIVTRYGPEGTPAASAVVGLRDDPMGTTSSAVGDDPEALCVLHDGTVALTTPENRTYLLDGDLSRVTGAWAAAPARDRDGSESFIAGPFMDFAHHPAAGFAALIRVTPAGRLLCVVAEFGTRGYGAFSPNLLALADGPLTPGGSSRSGRARRRTNRWPASPSAASRPPENWCS